MSFLDSLEAGNSGRVPEPVTQPLKALMSWLDDDDDDDDEPQDAILIHNTQPITAPHRL